MNDGARQGLLFRGRRYRAFLFDMDGTLIDSSAAVERMWRGWAERHGVDVDALLEASHGVRGEDVVRRFAAHVDVAAEVEALRRVEMEDVDGIVSVGGVEAFLRALDPACWAVVTSASRALAEVRMRAAGVPMSKTLVAAEDVERGKPHPEGFRKAARLLGVPIADCLAFEDSEAGVAAARASGATTVVVGGRVPVDDPRLSIADYRDV